MLTVNELAKFWGVSERWVTQMCRSGKIAGAVKEGRSWKIPDNADRPKDLRIKTGKFTKAAAQSDARLLPLPVGISDYVKVQKEYYYVDKTLLIRDILDKKPYVSLFLRPRRFGKTLNMDMLRVFFEKADYDTSVYFSDKNIWKCGKDYQDYQGRYPVISLTFKDVKYPDWKSSRQKIAHILQVEFDRHRQVLEGETLSRKQKEYFEKILNAEASDIELSAALEYLTAMLDAYYGIAPIIIIDEYDTPIEQGYSKGFYKEVTGFMRNFFSGGFKDNPHLSFGFMTGILKFAQGSLFSGLNNLRVHSMIDKDYASYFGFTEEEVQKLLEYYHLGNKYREIRKWYDGYLIGDTTIFNPWSIISYVDDGCTPDTYWVSTGNNAILDDILKNATNDISTRMNNLLQGSAVLAPLDSGVTYPMSTTDPSHMYSFLLATGYLKAKRKGISGTGNMICELSIPNKEISTVYRAKVLSHLQQAGKISQNSVNAIQGALISDGDDVLTKA
ncbi:MAG: AAA family ATPase [[Clostridium] aminophilum]|uniref:AAA family ATPase n=1 Tax=[Clostridium] aminophilum TaxID=1526 RepID=UPI0026F09804|nr:AAA family ATPase [[Clostridium] aminophilum]MDD6196772.1 AAA family ATPase [[Clostridium] aminophilum]